MLDKTILIGFFISFNVEIILKARQLSKLITSEQTDMTRKIVTDEEFEKMKLYNSDKLYFSIFNEIIGYLRNIFVVKWSLLLGLYFYLESTFPGLKSVVQQVIYMIFVINISRILELPMDLFYTFYIEEKHGFNKSTLKIFFMDFLKSTIIIIVLIGFVVYGMLYIIDLFPKSFYLYLWTFLSVFQLIMVIAYPILIQPLFNKFQELPDGDLKSKIEKLAEEVGFKAKKILTVDGSKRSGHSNAYFVGITKEKRVVLYDTLLSQLNEDEIVAVLAHEFGHWHFSHTLKQILFGLFMQFFYIYAFNFVVKDTKFNEMVFKTTNVPMIVTLIYFSFISNFLGIVLTPLQNYFTRVMERQADVFAVKKGFGESLKNGLIKIHKENKSNLCPDNWYSVYYHSHPTLVERLCLIESEMKKVE
ncbi:CAAX prenyl protease [Hamiltosporidium magnivora]|uniref:CAAX prenyl protease n=1 Tax=Hamiltosporidium magnivora TaxID=148818 RepID=A0A4Q9KUT0_9MICR|nr:CAAX prenyl protease [Hamiltosporidium magnivora]